MRYIIGIGAFAILGLAAWIWPPDAPHDPLVGSGYLGFILGWMLFLIPAGATLFILTGCVVWLGSAYAKVEKARRAKVPKSVSVSYSPHQRGYPTAPALPAPQQPTIDVTPAAIDVPSFSQLLDRGMIAAGHPLILGYTDRGMLTGSWRDLYSSAIAGLTGTGKTSTIRYLACQSAVHGARFVVIDPHADAGDESLAATLAALHASMLCEPADTEHSICDAARLVQSRMEARLHGDLDRTPLVLCVDEFTRLMRSPSLAPQLAGLVEAIGQEGRKVGVYAMLSGQIWTAERSGGSALRDSLASVYCHRLRRNQARMLLSPDEARLAEGLDIGQALLVRTSGECERVALPLATPGDVERVGRLLATPVQPMRNTGAIEVMASGRAVRSPREAQVISMLTSGATVPEVVKALYGETGKAYSDGVRQVSSIIGQALRQRER